MFLILVSCGCKCVSVFVCIRMDVTLCMLVFHSDCTDGSAQSADCSTPVSSPLYDITSLPMLSGGE